MRPDYYLLVNRAELGGADDDSADFGVNRNNFPGQAGGNGMFLPSRRCSRDP